VGCGGGVVGCPWVELGASVISGHRLNDRFFDRFLCFIQTSLMPENKSALHRREIANLKDVSTNMRKNSEMTKLTNTKSYLKRRERPSKMEDTSIVQMEM
jgi:hypothetical protein